MGLQWLLSLWLVLEYMQLGSLGLHFPEVPSATSVHKQPRQALGGAGSVCSAEQRRERGWAEVEALAAAERVLEGSAMVPSSVPGSCWRQGWGKAMVGRDSSQPNSSSVPDALSSLDGLCEISRKASVSCGMEHRRERCKVTRRSAAPAMSFRAVSRTVELLTLGKNLLRMWSCPSAVPWPPQWRCFQFGSQPWMLFPAEWQAPVPPVNVSRVSCVEGRLDVWMAMFPKAIFGRSEALSVSRADAECLILSEVVSVAPACVWRRQELGQICTK